MTLNSTQKILFVDTCKLGDLLKQSTPESKQLMDLCKQGTITIVVSEIAYNESAARKKECLIKDARNFDEALQRLHSTFKNSPIVYHVTDKINDNDKHRNIEKEILHLG